MVDSHDTERPDVGRYTDYRAFLRAAIAYQKSLDPAFSYAVLAERAGFRAKSYLKHVADGARNLAVASAPEVAEALGLDARETRIFQVMVALGGARSDAERELELRRLQRLTRQDEVARLRAEQYEAYARWFPMVIRELVDTEGFEEDPKWIARRLRPKIRADAAARALQLLERTGLLTRDDEGRLTTEVSQTVTTGPEVRSLAVRRFHAQMLEHAIAALDGVPQAERDITSVTLSLTRAQYERMTQRLQELRREVTRLWEAEASDTRRADKEVYQLTLALHPATQKVKKR